MIEATHLTKRYGEKTAVEDLRYRAPTPVDVVADDAAHLPERIAA